MTKYLLSFCLWSIALFFVGCDPPENTSAPASRTAPAEKTGQFTFNGSDSAYCIRFSPDGKTLASTNPDKTVSLWDVQTRQESARLTGHRYPAGSLAFTPDGNFLASVSDDDHTKKGKTFAVANPGQIILWDVEAQVEQKRFENSFSDWATYSPVGSLIAMRGPKVITLYDTESWQEIARQEVETHSNQAFFSPDGKSLAWGSLTSGEPIRLRDLTEVKSNAARPSSKQQR